MAGQQVARKQPQQVDGVFYFPFDFAFVVRRTLRIVKPRLFVMVETRDLAEHFCGSAASAA